MQPGHGGCEIHRSFSLSLYIGFVGLLYFFQRGMMYLPGPRPHAARRRGLFRRRMSKRSRPKTASG
jgi:hypothetical protein